MLQNAIRLPRRTPPPLVKIQAGGDERPDSREVLSTHSKACWAAAPPRSQTPKPQVNGSKTFRRQSTHPGLRNDPPRLLFFFTPAPPLIAFNRHWRAHRSQQQGFQSKKDFGFPKAKFGEEGERGKRAEENESGWRKGDSGDHDTGSEGELPSLICRTGGGEEGEGGEERQGEERGCEKQMLKRKRQGQGRAGGRGAIEDVDEDESVGGSLPIDEIDMDDALVALQLLRSEYPSTAARPRPIAFVSQIYAIVSDRTEVDKSLRNAQRALRVRMFLAPGSSTEMMLQDMADYRASVEESIKQVATLGAAAGDGGGSNRKPGQGRGEGGAIQAEKLARRFISRVLPKCTGLFVARSELSLLLDMEDERSKMAASAGGNDDQDGDDRPISVMDKKAMDLLVRAGALATRDAHSMWFTPVRCGTLLSEAAKGREELMGIVGRYKFGEILLRELCKKKLRSSTLGAKFHVRDLVGKGLLEIKQTTAGPMVKAIQSARRR